MEIGRGLSKNSELRFRLLVLHLIIYLLLMSLIKITDFIIRQFYKTGVMIRFNKKNKKLKLLLYTVSYVLIKVNKIKINFNMSFLKKIWEFLKVKKKYWLYPMLLVLLLFSGLIILSQGLVISPLIYKIF